MQFLNKLLLVIYILLLSACNDDSYLIDVPDLDDSIEDYYADHTLINGTYYNTMDMETLSFFITSLDLDDVDLDDLTTYYFYSDKLGWRWMWYTYSYNNYNYNARYLYSIEFKDTGINDEQLSSILDLHNLQTLELWNESNITILPEELSLNLPLLERLYIYNLADLTDIPDLPNESLTTLTLSNCQDLLNITPSPFTILSLESLYLSSLDNNFTFSIPSDIDNLTQLKDLSIYGNNMTGVIPDELFNLEDLKTLNLADSQLLGTISDNISILDDLTVLNLNGNNLSGEIPANIVLLDEIEFIDLSNNLLTGNIPADLFLNTSLRSIYLYNNNLSGDIPDTICDYISNPHNIINIEENNFCTYIPDCFTTLIGDQNCE